MLLSQTIFYLQSCCRIPVQFYSLLLLISFRILISEWIALNTLLVKCSVFSFPCWWEYLWSFHLRESIGWGVLTMKGIVRTSTWRVDMKGMILPIFLVLFLWSLCSDFAFETFWYTEIDDSWRFICYPSLPPHLFIPGRMQQMLLT